MSIARKAKKLALISSHPHLITCQTKYLFIISHMRARSSVFSHVLGSNPNICGYSELHRTYLNRKDLFDMRCQLYRDLECKLEGKYLLDKLLHNRFDVSDNVIKIAKPKILFLLRDAESTIKSIIALANRIDWNEFKDPESATDYYCSRLLRLEEFAKKIGSGYFFVDSEDLVDKTDLLLKNLTDWLDLKVPLSKEYSSFNNTGKLTVGDSSANIKSGVLKKTKFYHDIELPLDLLKRGQSSYEQCKTILLSGALKYQQSELPFSSISLQ